ncbi:MAG: S41 family peptidase [Bacteroidetes bacterium]|nr:MAG: S41 family peptidase [Bacteroidota bacterium]MBL1143805.1 S41 family peptidase [Bacteroidota bacterium]NOG56606.1 S41 family peptidase [Bacteroidota bacterium]
MKNRNIIVFLPIIIAVTLIIGVFLGQRMAIVSFASVFNTEKSNQTNKLNQVINFIKSDYVDSVKENWIVEETINGILHKLDPHSAYIPGEQFHEANDPLEGNFDGIGVEFRIQSDTVVVVKPISGGPSEKVGLMAGDRIVKVEDEEISGKELNNAKVMKLLKGPKGTKVNVGVKRSGVENILNFIIKRDEIPINSLESSYMINDTVGYIKIIRFAKTTYDEFMDAAENLRQNGMKCLVLDLRSNSGGYLNAATKLADEFLPKGKLIVYTEGKARAREDFYASSKGEYEKTPLIVLINEGSASASEILAGALQDNDRGLIVGRRSFGKGLVQEPMQWSDGSQIRLTVARYYTPTGRCIQRPYTEGMEAYNDDYYSRIESGELFSADSIHFSDSLKFYTKAGKVVYGGGGIMPDVFIPIDTIGSSNYYARLNYSGLFYLFGFEYTDKHREELMSSLKENTFIKKYQVDEKTFQEFVELAAKNGIEYNNKEAIDSKEIIKNRIKAAIGRNLFGNNIYYQIINKEDNSLQKSVQLFKKEKLAI